jgi:hypothetical protein
MGVTTMGTTVPQAEERLRPEGLWLRNRNWDTIFMTLSVLLVPIPYLTYLIGLALLGDPNGVNHDIEFGVRNFINLVIALLVGGPHMYATFMRTALDEQFVKRYPMLIRSSIIIPIVVVSLAFLNLPLLLTIFFFWASIHVLHQVTYVVELYNHRKKSALTIASRMIDYALILTCLFPLAAYKISQNDFAIGTNDLTKVIPDFFKADWLWWSASAVFAVALVLFIIKTIREIRGGYIHWPKTVFIVITVAVAFTMPALKNLDTAFQGLNTWHSFQYLALTIYIVRLRQQTGDLAKSNKMIDNLARGRNPWRLYAFTVGMVLGSLVLGVAVYITVGIVDPTRTMSTRFDTAYYTAILCFLWIHYYHDHFLFTDWEAVNRAAGPVATGNN